MLGMVADVAAMKSRLSEYQRQRQNIADDEGGLPRGGWTQAQNQPADETNTQHHQDRHQQFEFPTSQADQEICVPTQDTPV